MTGRHLTMSVTIVRMEKLFDHQKYVLSEDSLVDLVISLNKIPSIWLRFEAPKCSSDWTPVSANFVSSAVCRLWPMIIRPVIIETFMTSRASLFSVETVVHSVNCGRLEALEMAFTMTAAAKGFFRSGTRRIVNASRRPLSLVSQVLKFGHFRTETWQSTNSKNNKNKRKL